MKSFELKSDLATNVDVLIEKQCKQLEILKQCDKEINNSSLQDTKEAKNKNCAKDIPQSEDKSSVRDSNKLSNKELNNSPGNYVNYQIPPKKDSEYECVFLKKNLEKRPSPPPSAQSDNASSLTSRASTPEPFYMNENQLPENNIFNNFNIAREEIDSSNKVVERDVLYEFDPLMRQRDSTKNEMTNQLELLQNLLYEDIYGTVFEGLQFNPSLNEEISDEDNIADELFSSSVPSTEISVATSNTADLYAQVNRKNNKKNNLEDKTSEINKKKAQTSWYLDDTESIPNENFETDEVPPPPYADSSSDKSTFRKYVTSINENINFNINGKAEFNKMLGNFKSKISALKRKPSLKKSELAPEPEIILKHLPRPKLSDSMIRHEGFLIKFPSGAIEDIFKELQNRKALIRDYKFLAYAESELKNIRESIPLHDISTIQCVSNSKITENSTHYYCFEITTVVPKVLSQTKLNLLSSNGGGMKMQRSTYLYGISKESERDLWMQKLLQSMTDVFPNHYACQYYRAGWCYLKKSITTDWSGAWVMLSKRKRKLIIFNESDLILEKLDLRKARCIVMKDSDNSTQNLCVEQGPILMIDCPPLSLYLIMSCIRETKIWKHIIREVAYNNGPGLEEQQLTKNNIPVIVDKCVNFIFIHGSMSEGIYRKSGSENSIQKLIYDFRTNAFGVEITKSEYNEHDVANVLKRFMRNLPTKLLGKYSESFISVSQLTSTKEKVSSYRELMTRLSTVECMTIKKLLNHLAFIVSQNKYNKMNLENIAVVWGPTLLQRNSESDDLEYNNQEAEVLKDLITNFKHLFPLSKDEINKEKAMLNYLKKYYAASESLNELSHKQSGDLKVWITIKLNKNESDEDQTSLCVILNPGRTSLDVCKEIATKINKKFTDLCLFEIIFNKSLERPIHNDEKLFHTVLKWSYWPEDMRKNNFLVIKTSKYYEKMKRTLEIMKNFNLKKNLLYADQNTKVLRQHDVELNGTILSVKKITKNLNSPVKYFDLHNYTVYLGTERKLTIDWALTFIANENNLSLKTPESNFIGHIFAGNNKDDQIIVFSTIWKHLFGSV